MLMLDRPNSILYNGNTKNMVIKTLNNPYKRGLLINMIHYDTKKRFYKISTKFKT